VPSYAIRRCSAVGPCGTFDDIDALGLEEPVDVLHLLHVELELEKRLGDLRQRERTTLNPRFEESLDLWKVMQLARLFNHHRPELPPSSHDRAGPRRTVARLAFPARQSLEKT
jgi:hypothetical protein